MSAEHPNDIPGEYERSLLAALLEQAEREAREAGRKFSPAERPVNRLHSYRMAVDPSARFSKQAV